MSVGSLEGNLAMIEFELDVLYLKRTIAARPASPTPGVCEHTYAVRRSMPTTKEYMITLVVGVF